MSTYVMIESRKPQAGQRFAGLYVRYVQLRATINFGLGNRCSIRLSYGDVAADIASDARARLPFSGGATMAAASMPSRAAKGKWRRNMVLAARPTTNAAMMPAYDREKAGLPDG